MDELITRIPIILIGLSGILLSGCLNVAFENSDSLLYYAYINNESDRDIIVKLRRDSANYLTRTYNISSLQKRFVENVEDSETPLIDLFSQRNT